MPPTTSPLKSVPRPTGERPSLARRLELTLGEAPLGSVALRGLLCIAVFAVFYWMRSVLIPLTFATMLYFLLRPLVQGLQRFHVPRFLASAAVLGATLGALAFVVLELAEPALAWTQRLPSALHQIELKSRSLRYPLEHASRLLQALTRLVEEAGASNAPRVAVAQPGLLPGLVEGAATFTTQLGLTVVAAFFLLIEGDTLFGRLFRILPSLAEGQRGMGVINEVGSRMSRYLRTVTLVNVCLGAALTGVLSVLGMPNPWLWGCLAAVLTYVPYLGPAVGIALVALASFVVFPTTGAAVLPPLAYFVLATIEGNVVTPMILGRTFRVSPLVVFVWLTLWVWLWSVPGAMLACPLLMLLKLACDESPSWSGVGHIIRR